MGGKRRRRFAFESDRESPAARHTCCICRKRFRWTLVEDEEYDGDDEREVRQRKQVDSYWADWLVVWEDVEADEWEPRGQKRKWELTASQREKGVALAYPDPWGPSTTDEEDLVALYVGLLTTEVEGWGPGPLPDLLDLNRKAEDVPSDQAAEKGGTDDIDLAVVETNGSMNLVASDRALDKQGPLQEEILMPQPRSRAEKAAPI